MKISFESNLTYQLKAIDSVVNLFQNQSQENSIFIQKDHFLFHYVNNFLTISKEEIFKNLQKIQKENEIPISEKLEGLHFTVEMETGTGKTYVYLRTIYELNKKYGFKKFLIVVPSIAIREGVLKNLEITFEHFQNLYDKVPVNYYVYDSSKVSILRAFCMNNNIEILVINIDSFAKDENIINRPNDKLSGLKPIQFIQASSPIVIIDEPQNMETEKRKKAIESLNPLFILRYSATHKNFYNLVYSLSPVKAYDLGLVKQIEVDSVVDENAFNDAYISLEEIISQKTKVTAKLTIHVEDGGSIKKKTLTVKVGEDLYSLSNNREVYRGFVVEEIDVTKSMITFSNGIVLHTGMSRGGLTDEIMKVQIERTIEEHLKKELNLNHQGIKVLSLFFIDRVANYRYYDEDGNPQKGKIAKWFEELYQKIIKKIEFKQVKEKYHPNGIINFLETHGGYFSQDKKGKLKDTRGESEDDLNTYDLILKDKEKLLSLENPLRFIFSHSALREGWDNPNVFQICTLNETKSELKKRQEIGRGLRLCVSQNGLRVYDKNINKLTIVANESYESFAKQLQKEIEEDCGVSFEGRIKNKRERIQIKYHKGFELDPKFLQIWNKIKAKTRYNICYDTNQLIEKVSQAIWELPSINPPTIRSTKFAIDIQEKGIDKNLLSHHITYSENSDWFIPDPIAYIQQRTELTRDTIVRILEQSKRLQDIVTNPQLFLDLVANTIKRVMNELLVDGIKYEKIGNEVYEMRLFRAEELETYFVNNKDKTIYEEYIPLDSNTQSQFAKDCETSEQVEFYFKLPAWFKIPTPIGTYNPDGAVVLKNDTKIYFLAEIKDIRENNLNINKLHPDE